MSNIPAAQRADLAARNAAHEPRWWMPLSADDAQELAAGRVPELVQSMASWLTEDTDTMLARTTVARQKGKGKA